MYKITINYFFKLILDSVQNKMRPNLNYSYKIVYIQKSQR